ncbi:MAG: hypothetical protein IJF02_00920 [Oscillospiraceae bacterium]|nr:hypothetical protein [Oscillospiraceae bacterium]
MKREKLYSLLIGAVLAFCISFGSVAGIITGFSLSVSDGSVSSGFYTAPASIAAVAVFCAVFSAAAAIAFSYRRGGWILLGAMALSIGYLWRTGILETSVEAALYRITYVYNLAYRCGIVKWTDAFSPGISPNVGFCVLAAIPALLTTWAICRRKSAVLPVLCGCIILGICLVVTDTVPAIWCLLLLLTGMILLILTNTVRRQCVADGNRLTAMMLVPAVLYMSLLFGIVPQDGYESKADDMQQAIVDWFRSFSFGNLFDIGLSGNSTGSVDLSMVGPRTNFKYAVMDVTADKGGTLYLRGQSLDIYDGTSWKPSDASSEKDGGWPTKNCEAVGSVKLVTRSGMPVKYFPYYPGGSHWPVGGSLKDGAVSNPYRQREYSFQQMEITGQTNAVLSGEMEEQCLLLPHNTRIRAASHLKNAGYFPGQSEGDIARVVARYVSSAAVYDLNTGRMPSDENDFAMWFLQEADSGYCIHFASAAAVLLRAAGVPARYVSGYVVKASPGKTVTVTENRAHAWVEYFVPGEGWMVLDPTPAIWTEEPEDPPAPTEPSTKPTDPGTEPNPRPTQPEEKPTEPSQEPTTPEGNFGGDNSQMKIDLSWLWVVLKWLGILLAICFAVVGQVILRQRLWSKRMHTGHPNQRALARWRMVLKMCRLIKERPPEELYELAEKARFSQHTLTVGERMEFDRYLDRAEARLNEMHWCRRWLIRLIWAV